ncbi:formylglycine-generating enzyme family protein [uncultured Methanomethylovorans sp.]|uniref:formylglycine-generating enzyme family protein n=1 Tax=uncultured Methanomethylovorans sp. TaxID=183759 RepID=UPI003749387B
MESAIKITRKTEFYQGYIRLKMAVNNESPYLIGDVSLDFIYDDDILRIDRCKPESISIKQGKYTLGNIDGGSSKSITIYFDPLTCSKGIAIDCNITFKDYQGKRSIVQMETTKISVTCPILNTDSDINIAMLKEFIEKLPSRDSRIYEVQNGFNVEKLVNLSREILQKHSVKHVRTMHDIDDKKWEIWYYGKTTVKLDDIVIKISINTDDNSLELFAATQTAESLVGLLAEIGRELKEGVESQVSGKGRVVNVSISKSKIDRSNLLDLCNMDGTCDVNVVIEKSDIYRSGIGSTEVHEINSFGNDHTINTGYLHQLQDSKKPSGTHGRKIGKKALLFSVLVIIVLAGYLMLSPLLVDNFDNQDTVVPQNTKIVDSSVAATETNNISIDDKTASTNTQLNLETYTNSIGMEFVLIPSGEFEMGSDDLDPYETPVHEVTIENAYYLGKYEVTQEQWVEIMGANPSKFEGDNNPVEYVSWDDVQEFVKKLNAKEGTDKYRLPSEAEWEYACRAGTITKYSFGDDESILGHYAWYYDNSGYETHPVGQKRPNPWGLYDMHGNVAEWVQDELHDSYNGAPTDGSAWEDGNILYREFRGGSYFFSSQFSANRAFADPSFRYRYVGFRLVREV